MSAFPNDADLSRAFAAIFAPNAPAADLLPPPRRRDPRAARLEAGGRVTEAHGEYLVALGEAMQAEADAMEADDEDRAWWTERATRRAQEAAKAHDAWTAAKRECAALFPLTDEE